MWQDPHFCSLNKYTLTSNYAIIKKLLDFALPERDKRFVELLVSHPNFSVTEKIAVGGANQVPL